MNKINYITGDALELEPVKIIAHCNNNEGAWGSGFVLALSDKWEQPEEAYRRWFYNGQCNKYPYRIPKTEYVFNEFKLGNIQLVQVEDNIGVANMIAQHLTISSAPNSIPIQYDKLEECFNKLAEAAKELNAEIVMPRIGCGLAKGSWAEVEKIIERTLIKKNLPVSVYTLEGDKNWS